MVQEEQKIQAREAEKHVFIFYILISCIVSLYIFVESYSKETFFSFINSIYYFIYVVYFWSMYVIPRYKNKKISMINFFIFVSALANVFVPIYWKRFWEFFQGSGLIIEVVSILYFVSMFLPYILLFAVIIIWRVKLSNKEETAD